MNKKWETYTRGTVPLYRIDFFDAVQKAALEYGKKSFCSVLYAHENGKTWWNWSKEGADEWGKNLMNTLNDKKKRNAHYKRYDSYYQRAIKASEKIRAKNLSNLNNKKITGLYDFLEKETDPAMGMPTIDLDVFDMFFERYLQNRIREKLDKNNIRVSDKEFSDIYNDLSIPVYKSYVYKEEEAIASAASKKEAKEKDIKKIYDAFWWTSLGWENVVPKDIKYFEKEVGEYSKKNTSNTGGMLSLVSKTRKQIINKYKLGKDIKDLLEIFDKFVCFHDLRKETQCRTIWSFNLLLKEVSKRFDIKDEKSEWYLRKDIVRILSGKKINSKEINKRQRSILVIAEKSGVKIFSGAEATKRREKELEEEIEDTSELKGMGVGGGIVKARVKVCNGIRDAREKLKSGDILVTGMTTPDYVPVMKVASAIITDEGGITCHAAIVSRELKKPCIVGTKIATKILKDGDLVEVDADKGVVKILK